MMARYEFEGRSAAEAAIKACEELGMTRAALQYNIVSDAGEGIDRRVVISVEHNPDEARPVLAVEDDASASSSRNVNTTRGDMSVRGGRRRRERDDGRRGRGRPRRGESGGRYDRSRPSARNGASQSDDGLESLLKLDASPDDGPTLPELTGEISARAQQAKRILNDILKHMHFDAVGVVVKDGDDEIHLDIRGEDAKRVVGHKGEPLLSLQFLVNRMVGNDSESGPVVVLDVAGYRERRRAALADLAFKLAKRAIEEHKVVKLSPMSAHDRRVFHLTLSEMNEVTTKSEGDGLFRRLLIIPEEFADSIGR